MKKNVHYPLVLVIIAALCVAGIDIVYSSVKDRIKEADEKKAREAVRTIFRGCSPESIRKLERYYECPDGYAIVSSAQGFDGAVTVMAGWDKPLEKVRGIYVLSHTETPGLGANVDMVNSENTWYNVITFSLKDESGERPDFQKQFRNCTPEEAKLQQDGGKLDALISATITSRAVVNAVQKSHKILKAILTKQGQEAGVD